MQPLGPLGEAPLNCEESHTSHVPHAGSQSGQVPLQYSLPFLHPYRSSKRLLQLAAAGQSLPGWRGPLLSD